MCDRVHGSTIRAEVTAETSMLSPRRRKWLSSERACLVDAAIGSKLTPRRAEHVTQVGVDVPCLQL